MSHDCVKVMNTELAKYNTQLEEVIAFTSPIREIIALRTTKIDPRKRGRAMNCIASFCPFCGVKLDG